MSAQLPDSVPTSKGTICRSLEKISLDPVHAMAWIVKLRDTIKADAPNYPNLTAIFDLHAFEPAQVPPATRAQAIAHLNTFWFDAASPSAYFPGVPVARIYAEGVVKTLDLSANGPHGTVVPITAWWLLDVADVRLINMTEIDNGVTTGSYVILQICTPRPEPQPGIAPTPPWIVGRNAEAFVTRGNRDDTVETLRVQDLR